MGTLRLNKDGKIEDKMSGLLYGSAEWQDWVDHHVMTTTEEECKALRAKFQATPEEEAELEAFRNRRKQAATA